MIFFTYCLLGYNLAERFIIPSIIKRETLRNLLKDIVLIPRATYYDSDHPKSVIGYKNCQENQCVVFSNTKEFKNIVSDVITNKQKICDCSTVKRSGSDEIVVIKNRTLKEMCEMIQSGEENGLLICCLKAKEHSLGYNVLSDGPLCCSLAKKFSRTSDLLSFGPFVTSLHVDTDYGNRTSLIPSWNVGVIKLWFIRRSSTARTQKLVNPTRHELTPQQQLETIFKERDEYYLLVQEPGDVMQHRGKHYHFVITVVDRDINPSGLCLSVGKIETTREEKEKFVKQAPPVIAKPDGSLKKVSRDTFIKNQLGKGLASDTVLKDLKKNRKKRKAKKERGFCKGNNMASSSKKHKGFITEEAERKEA